MYTKTISRLRLGDYKPIKCRIRILCLATSSFFSFVWINRMDKFKGFGYSEVTRHFNCYIRTIRNTNSKRFPNNQKYDMCIRYLFSVVETPRQFTITEFSIRKLGSSSVLIIPSILYSLGKRGINLLCNRRFHFRTFAILVLC